MSCDEVCIFDSHNSPYLIASRQQNQSLKIIRSIFLNPFLLLFTSIFFKPDSMIWVDIFQNPYAHCPNNFCGLGYCHIVLLNAFSCIQVPVVTYCYKKQLFYKLHLPIQCSPAAFVNIPWSSIIFDLWIYRIMSFRARWRLHCHWEVPQSKESSHFEWSRKEDSTDGPFEVILWLAKRLFCTLQLCSSTFIVFSLAALWKQP